MLTAQERQWIDQNKFTTELLPRFFEIEHAFGKDFLNWRAITVGWMVAKGKSPTEATELANKLFG